MNYHSISVIYSILVCLASLAVQNASSPSLLILFTVGYSVSHLLHKRIPSSQVVQIALLAGLHVISRTELILPLYILHMGSLSTQIKRLPHLIALNSGLLLIYSAVTLMDMGPGLHSKLTLLYTAGSSLVFSLLFRRYTQDAEKLKQRLTHEKQHLSTHDSLTGLPNFQEFHKQLELLIGAQRPFLLILIDCKDLKSLNSTNGFQGVNRILKQAAQLLRIMFSEAVLISRYGGDEFAIVIQTNQLSESRHRITQLLTYEFPKLSAIEVNFGITSYPEDGMHKDDLIPAAEHHLYLMKRESWLKREEHMLRSEKLRVVGELVSGMAHEIRNPLTTVKGFLQLSKAGNYNVEPWYDLIMDEINRMSMLTAEFLQFSKPHVTQYKIHSLTSCIYRVISLLESESIRLGHRIIYDHPPYELKMLMDQDKMLQLLLNLVKNAYEAMAEQGIVHIKLTSLEGSAILEITDNGKGVPEAELEKIFIPFYTTKDTGTGLGLSICHKIVQDHEGSIEVESLQGLGTKFTISLPLHVEADYTDACKTEHRSTIPV